jgi:hypothetical protein
MSTVHAVVLCNIHVCPGARTHIQEGSTSQALTELNELELELRGNPETHAALAAVLYAERPAQRWRAEQQWDIAVGFDARYADLAWVQESKRWPPKLVGALQQFLALR